MDRAVVLATARAEVGGPVRAAAAAAGIGVEETASATGAWGRVVDGADGAIRDRILLLDVDLVAAGRPGSADYLDPARFGVTGDVVLLHRAGEGDRSQRTALELGAHAVVELPLGASGLAELLGGRTARAPLLGVVGAVGGAGATTVALACAVAARDALLIDCDPWSTGLDLPLGIAPDRGGRWASIPDTTRPLVAESLRSALPRIRGTTVLTGGLPTPPGDRVAAAVLVGRTGFGCVVADCGRSAAGVPLGAGDRAVIVTPASLAGAVATRRVLDTLVGATPVLAVRPGGHLPTDELADHLGVRAVVEVPRVARLTEAVECGEVLAGRTGRDLARVGDRVWQALG